MVVAKIQCLCNVSYIAESACYFTASLCIAMRAITSSILMTSPRIVAQTFHVVHRVRNLERLRYMEHSSRYFISDLRERLCSSKARA